VTRKKSEPPDARPPSVPPTVPRAVPTGDPAGAAIDGTPALDTPAWDDQPTVNLTGDILEGSVRDDRADDAAADAEDAAAGVEEARELTRVHLRGLVEALVFASDKPVKSGELARLASAPVKQVRELLGELKGTYADRGVVLDEVAGGWLFRTSVQYAPFVREMSNEKPVRLTRAQVETLAIAAYRQPITRPEIDDIRGVDSGATLKLLLERDLVRMLGKKDEPGRPILYGTTTQFLEFFGLKSLKDLPTLKEFTELSDESRRTAEAELGDVLPEAARPVPETLPPIDMPPPPPPDDTSPSDSAPMQAEEAPDGEGDDAPPR
jgi:segregation and condensation protein B